MRLATAVLVCACVVAGCDVGREARPGATGPPRAGAAADVALLVDQLEAIHPDPYHAVSREEFRAAARALAGRIDRLDRDQALVALMRLLTRLGERDGHTGIFPLDPAHRRPLHLYPIRLYDFADGLVVVAAPGRPGLVGARLEAVAGTGVDALRRAVAPLVPRDNRMSLRARLPQYLVTAEVLHGLGVTADAGPAPFRFRLPSGERRDVTFAPVAAARYAAAFPDLFHPMVPPGLPRRAGPPWLARRLDERWIATLAGGRAIVAAYNVTLGDTEAFARELLRRARRPGVERVVVDLRHNPGGDNSTYRPLLDALAEPAVDRPGRLVALIGRTTFSAAANFATELERTTGVVFVGEPSGGSPNLYGDPVPVALPACGVTAHIAAVYWRKSRADDARTAIAPDLAVPARWADVAAGRDPALAAALAR